MTVARGSAVVVEELARCGERQRLCVCIAPGGELLGEVVGELGLGKGQQRGHELGGTGVAQPGPATLC